MLRLGTCFLFVVMALVPQAVGAQTPTPQLLDGTEIEYSYPELGTVVMRFYDGMLEYRWIAGPQAGVEIRDRAYQSRQIRDGLYLVSWHDPENRNFAALLFDLQEEREYAAVIGGYGTDEEAVLFEETVIQRVTREP